jgi:arabinogalactan endo-1,4-beta-galactosidase
MTDRGTAGPVHVRRRTVLLGAAAGAGALAAGAGALMPSAEAATFVKGADISWMPQMEAGGYYWNNSSGVRQDLFTILKGYGITAVSLRTWVNPSSDPANGHCSIEETAQLAQRAKNAGLRVLIGFHLGDTWNSAGVQNPPAAWAGMSYSQMLQAMYDYVYHSCNVIKYYGVTPAWVKIGNESNSGICKPTGSLSKPAQMTGLLNAAYDMSKQRAFITGLKGFGGLGTFFWEPEGYAPFTSYGSTAWDSSTRRPTAAMDGFLNV